LVQQQKNAPGTDDNNTDTEYKAAKVTHAHLSMMERPPMQKVGMTQHHIGTVCGHSFEPIVSLPQAGDCCTPAMLQKLRK
jgi:hypothetical protein